MRKLLVLLALLAIQPVCWQPLRGQAPRVGIKASGNKKGNPKLTTGNPTPPQPGTKATPFVVDAKGHQNSPEETAKDKREEDHKAFVDRWTVGATVAVAAFTGILMIIGGLGVYAANKTLTAISEQGLLMKRQADLMAVPYRSWIKLENWRAEYSPGPSPPSTGKLRIQVDIVNDAGFPVTVVDGGIAYGNVGAAGHSRFEMGIGSFMPPKASRTVDIWIFINAENAAMFVGGSIFVPAEGEFHHYGPLGRDHLVTQPFSGLLQCGQQLGARFHFETHMNPVGVSETGDSESHNPN